MHTYIHGRENIVVELLPLILLFAVGRKLRRFMGEAGAAAALRRRIHFLFSDKKRRQQQPLFLLGLTILSRRARQGRLRKRGDKISPSWYAAAILLSVCFLFLFSRYCCREAWHLCAVWSVSSAECFYVFLGSYAYALLLSCSLVKDEWIFFLFLSMIINFLDFIHWYYYI